MLIYFDRSCFSKRYVYYPRAKGGRLRTVGILRTHLERMIMACSSWYNNKGFPSATDLIGQQWLG